MCIESVESVEDSVEVASTPELHAMVVERELYTQWFAKTRWLQDMLRTQGFIVGENVCVHEFGDFLKWSNAAVRDGLELYSLFLHQWPLVNREEWLRAERARMAAEHRRTYYGDDSSETSDIEMES